MNIAAALSGIKYEVLFGSADVEVSDVVYDSRKAAPKTVFVCMVGARVDSHEFISQVLAQGVRAIVTERDLETELMDKIAGMGDEMVLIRVENARAALAHLSAAHFGYPARKMVCIGVTGTKGKTTTTYMIKAILEAAGKKVGLIGTAGAVIGDRTYPTVNTTPESYELHRYFAQMVEEGCEYMVMEVSSQGIKMRRVDGIWFDFGLFTNISNDHIGPNEHESFEEYLYYKSQLLNHCSIGLINRDDEHYEQVVRQVKENRSASGGGYGCYTYAITRNGDFMADDIRYVSEPDFVGLDFHVCGRLDLEVRVGIPGRFNVYNALAAVAVCSFLNLPEEIMGRALEHVHVNGRMEIVHTSERCTVIVDYAHNAVSMESLLRTLRDYHPKRLVCVFGCGGNRSKDRRYSMGEIGGRLADLCILTADNSRYEKVEDILADIRGSMEKTGGAFIQIPDRREAIRYSIVHAQPGDMIAVIGKGHEDYQEINGVRYPFLDRQVIEEVIEELEGGRKTCRIGQ